MPQILSQSEFFKDPDLLLEKELIEAAYENPTKIKQFWLDWMKGADSFEFKNCPVHAFLREVLTKKGPLWVAGEDAFAVNNIRQSLDDQGLLSTGHIYTNEDYETLRLRCKKGNLRPTKGQLVLWVDCDSKGHPIVSGLDEVSGRLPGQADFSFNRIFRLRKNWALASTGFIPTCYETLGLNSKIDVRIFNGH